jgi:hypothetical protein
MMERAGYIQRNRCRAYDSDGHLHEVMEVYIRGSRHAIRVAALAGAITGRVVVQVEELTHNWNYYLGLTCGLAQVSVSGKALNINLFNDGSFTVSLGALRSIMYGKEKLALIMKIPNHCEQLSKMKRISQDQMQISATG